MTNEEIVFRNRVILMANGVISGIPGTTMKFKNEQGEEKEIMIPEEIFTFEEWKRRGYMVQKGQHSIARFPIWMPKKGKKAEPPKDVDEKEMNSNGFYMKVAYFFTLSQVKKIDKEN